MNDLDYLEDLNTNLNRLMEEYWLAVFFPVLYWVKPV